MRIYEQLWGEAVTAFELGRPQVDLHLPGKTNDRRRGVSLIFRLPAEVQTRIQSFLDSLARDLPGQYFYQQEELHVTVVTLISATELWRQEIGDVKAFRGILNEVLSHHPPFQLEFRGVTAAPNAVLIQGFPRDDTLEKIRSELRRIFAQRGFANRLDRRYPNSAAHVTAVRFCKADADWKRLLAILQANRQTPFGEMSVETLQLVWGDWYASANNLRILEEFPLPKPAPPPGSKASLPFTIDRR
jgi:2'-5' RNA ligase